MLTRRLKLEVWHEGPAPISSSSSNGTTTSTQGSSSKGTRRRLLTGRMRALGLRTRDSAGQGCRDGSSSAHAPGRLHHQQQLHKPSAHADNSSSSSGEVVSHQLPDIPEEDEAADADSATAAAAAGAAAAGRANNDDVSSHMLLDLEVEDAAEDIVETEGHQLLQDGSSSSGSGGGVSLGSAVVNLEQLTEAVIQVSLRVGQHARAWMRACMPACLALSRSSWHVCVSLLECIPGPRVWQHVVVCMPRRTSPGQHACKAAGACMPAQLHMCIFVVCLG
jgi:hypothetical protein